MTATLVSSMGCVEHFLADLQNVEALQRTVSSSNVEEILALCQRRGVIVDAGLLSQFIA